MSFTHFNFSADDLAAAEAETANPYLANPTKGLQLITRLIAHPPACHADEKHKHLARLHQLIHHDFFKAAARDDYPAEVEAFRELLALEESLEDLLHFPDLANKMVVGVGGGFSAGKSRFINTLLGEALLPEALEPTTAIPSYLTGGASSNVALNAFNHQVEIDADALNAISHSFHKHYQMLGENIGFAHVLKLLMIHRPSFYWENLAFLDTPGYSKAESKDAGQTDQNIALTQLIEADHLIWLLNAKNGSIRQDDLNFLRTLRHPQPVFFVVTQADLVGDTRIHPILESVSQAIDAAGIPRAGLMAWAGPLGQLLGQRIAGDDVMVWLNGLNATPRFTSKRDNCARVLDNYIRHNQNCLESNRQKLKLFNALLPLAAQLQASEQQALRDQIRNERANQGRFDELISDFVKIKIEMLEAISMLLGTLKIDDACVDTCVDETVVTLFQKGLAIYRGDHSAADHGLAVVYFQKAAERGYANAQNRLAICYEFGIGVARNIVLAVSWYQRAAGLGHADAQYFLGACYEYGTGIARDNNLAKAWYREAAAQGHAEAKAKI